MSAFGDRSAERSRRSLSGTAQSKDALGSLVSEFLQHQCVADLKQNGMSSESEEKFQQVAIEYQAGQTAFERGQYRESVQHLARAGSLAGQNSRLGGEIQIWLVTAYEAAGQRQDAIALCRQLKHHPAIETRKQSRQLLYILEAPRLNLRPEWLTQIPDLSEVSDDDSKYRRGGSTSSAPRPAQSTSTSEPIDLSQINTKDNRFIWIALLAIALTLGGLVWLS